MGVVANCRCIAFGCMVGFCLILGGHAGQSQATAKLGQAVTLQCSYDVAYYGRLAVCWGRGPIPNSGCNDEVLRATGSGEVSRLSERYRLAGDLDRGDVSLTITGLQDSDAGVYGCRVDIPGWFNDHIHETSLSVVPDTPRPVTLQVGKVTEKTITVHWTPGPDGGRPLKGYRIEFKNKTQSWDTASMEDDIRPALTQVTLINMRPDQSYSLRMFASNSVGRSAPSNVLTVTTPEAAPEGPPLDVQLEALTPRSIKITWKPPKTELRNGLLGNYGLSYREYSNRQFGRWHHLKVPATATSAKDTESLVLNNLRPATQYYVIVRASTSGGFGPPFIAPPCNTLIEVLTTSTAETTVAATTFQQSTTTLSPVPPDPPVLELLEVKDKQVSLYWTAGFDGGVPISSYDLEYKVETASWDSMQRFGGYGPNQTETTLIEMLPATYSVRMFALNSVGSSAPSNVLTVTIAEKGHPKDLSTLVPHTTGTPTPSSSTTLTPTATPTPSPSTLTPTSTPTSSSTLTPSAVRVEESHGPHPAVVAVPVLLVMVAVALGVTWQMRRMKGRNGILTMGYLSAKRLRNSSEPSSQL